MTIRQDQYKKVWNEQLDELKRLKIHLPKSEWANLDEALDQIRVYIHTAMLDLEAWVVEQEKEAQ